MSLKLFSTFNGVFWAMYTKPNSWTIAIVLIYRFWFVAKTGEEQ